MAKKKHGAREPVEDLLDALVWMRRKAKKHEPVDDLIDALVKMRRKAKDKAQRRSPAVASAAVGKRMPNSSKRKAVATHKSAGKRKPAARRGPAATASAPLRKAR